MSYALLIISLIAFFIGGYVLMERLDRFLNSNKIVEEKKERSLSFDKSRLALWRDKRHLPNGVEV